VKNWKLDRIISIATLAASVLALILVLKRPAPIASPQTASQAIANAQSFQDKLAQLDPQQTDSAQPQSNGDSAQPASATSGNSGSAGTATSVSALSSAPSSSLASSSSSSQRNEAHFTSDEVSAAIAQASGALSNLSPNSDIGSMPAIKDQQVSFDGDVVHGQFLTNIAGKDVWVTVSGHIGEKDGYATFDPTEFKIGDLDIPVSLVNGPLQKKLAEQRDRLKLPNNVGDVKVQGGQLVLQQK
jgi:hypothetical protein